MVETNIFDCSRVIAVSCAGKGQRSLQELGAMDRILRYSTVLNGAITWNPNSPIDKPEERDNAALRKSYRTVCIERDRLTACLLEEIRASHPDSISVHFNIACVNASLESSETGSAWTLQMYNRSGDERQERVAWGEPGQGLGLGSRESGKEFSVRAAFLVGADGANSIVRDAMVQLALADRQLSPKSPRRPFRFNVHRFEDTNVRLYRTIPLYPPFPSSPSSSLPQNQSFQWKRNMSYSARVQSDVNLEALPGPPGLGVFLGVVLFRPTDRRVTSLASAEDARAFFQALFPAFLPCLRQQDLARFAAKKDRKFPRFLFVGPVLHHYRAGAGAGAGAGAVLLGDSAHTVKPFFGLGVNSAFEDVCELGRAIRGAGGALGTALQTYSQVRASEARELVQLSRGFDGGFLSFVLPIILDSLFHRALPGLFAANAISLMQNDQYSYGQVRARKRRDRVGQVLLLSLAAALSAAVAKVAWQGARSLLPRLWGLLRPV